MSVARPGRFLEVVLGEASRNCQPAEPIDSSPATPFAQAERHDQYNEQRIGRGTGPAPGTGQGFPTSVPSPRSGPGTLRSATQRTSLHAKGAVHYGKPLPDPILSAT